MSGPGTATTAADRGTGDHGSGTKHAGRKGSRTATAASDHATEARGTEDRGVSQKAPPKSPDAVSTSTIGDQQAPAVQRDQTKDPQASALRNFMRLMEEGPKNPRTAPQILTLPRPLFRDMLEQLDASQDDNNERGLVFGYTAPRITYGSILVEGNEDQINYSKAREVWQSLKVVGLFHTHPLAFGVNTQGGATGVTGGGHSGNDLANFFRRSERASAVASYRIDGKRVIYLLLKPQNFTIPGTPQKVGEMYREKVVAKLDKGIDPHDASRQELTNLAREGAFILYIGIDSPVFRKQE